MFSTDTGGDLTLNQLMLSLERRGPLALIIMLCLPFMTPISLPGVSNVFGAVILYLAVRIFLGLPAGLPHRLGQRTIQGPLLSRVVRASLKALRWLERGIHPRPTSWVTTLAARRFNASLIFLGGLLLALPLPPTIPCSNLVPAAGIILLACSMAEEDGRTIWLAYSAILGATAYLGVMIWLQTALLLKIANSIWNSLVRWHLG